MYTEDDDDVSLKDDNSTDEYNDFYTSFNDLNNKDNNSKKEKKKKNKEKKQEEPKTESDYAGFYGTDEEETPEENNEKKGNIIKISIVIALFVAIIVLLFVLLGKGNNEPKGDIELLNSEMTLNMGETSVVSYNIVNTESSVTSTFVSSNPNIASVDNNGKVIAIAPGTTTIVVNYTIDGKTRSKDCKVTVNKSGDVNTDISLTLGNVKDNSWTNKDVEISVSASSIYGIDSVKYAINCDSNCGYKNVENDKIIVNNPGTTKVIVEAVDKGGQKANKTVTVKIDKDSPTATLTGDKNVSGTGSVKVCAECTDELSGCKQKTVCKTFTSSKSGQTITVEDNAGNTSKSESFNVTITKKMTEPCSLSVSSKGIVTATLREEASYYGFNSSYSGSNTKSMQVEISASKTGERGAKVVYYYVKNKNGTGGLCYITVIKECKCTDSKSTDANCPVTCTYSGH